MQPPACKAEVGTADLVIEQGRSGCLETGTDFLGGGEISNAIRVRDMGPEDVYADGVGRFPP